MRMTTLHNARLLSRARAQDGVTMIIAMGVMLVTSLLLTASFLATQGDIRLSHTDTAQKEAYYAALAGVQEFEYQMQVNPNYWETCGKTDRTRCPRKPARRTKSKSCRRRTATECSTSNPFGTVIESTGAAANTFRIESVGYCRQESGRASHDHRHVQSQGIPQLHLLHEPRGQRSFALAQRILDVQKPKYILSQYVGMRSDSFCDRR